MDLSLSGSIMAAADAADRGGGPLGGLGLGFC